MRSALEQAKADRFFSYLRFPVVNVDWMVHGKRESICVLQFLRDYPHHGTKSHPFF